MDLETFERRSGWTWIARLVTRGWDRARHPRPPTYAEGGFMPHSLRRIPLRPDECILKKGADGDVVCVRPDHEQCPHRAEGQP